MKAIRDLAIIFGAAIALQIVVASCRPAPELVLPVVVNHPAACAEYAKGDRILIDRELVEVVDVAPGRLTVKRAPDATTHAAGATLLCMPPRK